MFCMSYEIVGEGRNIKARHPISQMGTWFEISERQLIRTFYEALKTIERSRGTFWTYAEDRLTKLVNHSIHDEYCVKIWLHVVIQTGH